MSRIVIVVMVMGVVVGLWVAKQAINTKRMVEERHATLMSMMGVIEK